MSLLELIVIVTGFIFLLFAIDARQRKKLNVLHLTVFVGGSTMLIYFILYPGTLDRFGSLFGIARGADLIVYCSIIFLAYLFFELLNKINKQSIIQTNLARAVSLQQAIGTMRDQAIVFIIPAYNEDETAVRTVQSVLEAGYAVVYIDDGSSRISQVDVLTHLHHPNLVIIKHIINLGQGAALQTGMDYVLQYCAHTEYVVHFDADGQMQLSDIPGFLDAFAQDPELDIVVGSRYLGQAENIPLARKVMKWFARMFMKVFVGLKLTDTHNGYRMIHRSALSKLRITLDRMAHASEIEHLIAQQKLHYAEVPVHILYTDYSLTKGQQISGMRKVAKDFLWKVLFYK